MDNNKNKIVRTLILNAGTDKVWNALTNPVQTKKYMFNCEVTSDWKVGSEIKWKGNYEGYESGERGKILEIDKYKKLKYSSIDPNFGIELKPENYLHITYHLNDLNEKTKLILTVESFNNDPKRMEHIAGGWDNIVLPAIERIFNQ
ncbi:SRPBCC domain-containing protein [Pedobacter sp. Hv1]|uniref:SRPBCC family protein n=1 Tax=Pedobacter sp. Hv1 TaxID=1740090 RepID=UPI0006D8B6E1|nr:SRPBCC domain-containing protein [Pedobacter sp. Hv1]KQC01359.1 hypothetical protein AQF98_06505 [Pedobacter sp. Hv1]